MVNAAFWTEPEAPIVETPEEDWIRCLDVNVVGTWRVLTALHPYLNQPGAAIVAIGSQAGTKPSATLAAYAAAKSAVTSLTSSAALQWAPASGSTASCPARSREMACGSGPQSEPEHWAPPPNTNSR